MRPLIASSIRRTRDVRIYYVNGGRSQGFGLGVTRNTSIPQWEAGTEET